MHLLQASAANDVEDTNDSCSCDLTFCLLSLWSCGDVDVWGENPYENWYDSKQLY